MDPRDDALEALWQRVLEDWQNPKAHDALLQLAFDHQELGRVAGYYRSQLEDEARKEVAEKKLGAIATLALQVMETSKTDPNKKAPRWLVLTAVAVCATGIAVLAWALST